MFRYVDEEVNEILKKYGIDFSPEKKCDNET